MRCYNLVAKRGSASLSTCMSCSIILVNSSYGLSWLLNQESTYLFNREKKRSKKLCFLIVDEGFNLNLGDGIPNSKNEFYVIGFALIWVFQWLDVGKKKSLDPFFFCLVLPWCIPALCIPSFQAYC